MNYCGMLVYSFLLHNSILTFTIKFSLCVHRLSVSIRDCKVLTRKGCPFNAGVQSLSGLTPIGHFVLLFPIGLWTVEGNIAILQILSSNLS